MATPLTGLKSKTAIGLESPSWGTWTPPTKGVRFQTNTVEPQFDSETSPSLGTGVLANVDTDDVQTTVTSAGDLTGSFFGYGELHLLYMLNGDTPVPTELVADAAYKWGIPFGKTAPDGKGLSMQQILSATLARSYWGGKVLTVELSLAVAQPMTKKYGLDFAGYAHDKAVVVPTVDTSGAKLNGLSSTITIDGSVLADCITEATLTLTLPLDTDNRCLNGSPVKDEQEQMDLATASLAVKANMKSLTIANQAEVAERHAVLIESRGPVLSGVYRQGLDITMANAKVEGFTAQIAGPGKIEASWNYKALILGNNPLCQLDYYTSQKTL